MSLDTDGPVIGSARVAIGAATDKPERLLAVEALLTGGTVDEATLNRAGDAAASDAAVESDARGSAAYKTELIRVCMARVIRQAMDETPGPRSDSR